MCYSPLHYIALHCVTAHHIVQCGFLDGLVSSFEWFASCDCRMRWDQTEVTNIVSSEMPNIGAAGTVIIMVMVNKIVIMVIIVVMVMVKIVVIIMVMVIVVYQHCAQR